VAADKCLACGRQAGDPIRGCMVCDPNWQASPASTRPSHADIPLARGPVLASTPVALGRTPMDADARRRQPDHKRFVPRAELVATIRRVARVSGYETNVQVAFEALAEELEKGGT
jgi:hypothetical protein